MPPLNCTVHMHDDIVCRRPLSKQTQILCRPIFCQLCQFSEDCSSPFYFRQVTVYRQDCRAAANCRYCFYSQAKNQVFRPQGRLVAPIQVKLYRTDGHLGPLGCAKSHLNRPRGWECGPKNIKNFHFLVNSRSAGATPLTNFQNFRGFYTPNYPTLVFQISCDSHHRLRSYC